MKNFLIKELKLCLVPVNYVYFAFAVMTLIPAYPRYVPFFFFCVSVLQIFNHSLLNKDIEYSMILPIRKKEIVKSRCLLVAGYEIVATILTVPFSILFYFIMPDGNPAGIEGNVAFYGFALILMTIFNYVFFKNYYIKASKPGIPFLKAGIAFWIFFIIFEMPIYLKDVVNIPFFQMLDKCDSSSLIKQLPILAAGITIFFVGWIITYKISANRFDKADL